MRDYECKDESGFRLRFHAEDGVISTVAAVRLDYKSAVNLASALLQWASQLPESERGSVFVNEEELQ